MVRASMPWQTRVWLVPGPIGLLVPACIPDTKVVTGDRSALRMNQGRILRDRAEQFLYLVG